MQLLKHPPNAVADSECGEGSQVTSFRSRREYLKYQSSIYQLGWPELDMSEFFPKFSSSCCFQQSGSDANGSEQEPEERSFDIL